ncbi:MAG: diacylglycerol kinase [Rhodoferax sp.]|nr:diacylglycerol kinase [Rhodoferax sp.]
MTAHPLPPPDAAPLRFVINAAAGHGEARSQAALIETMLREHRRPGELLICTPADLGQTARRAAGESAASGGAVVAIGGDGTINAVAGAAHAAGCPLGIVPRGTFNYFARAHGIADDPLQALRALLHARPKPVQVAAVNGQLFLVNASLGLYPDLLQDREAYKARFGRNRWVAFGAGVVTLLRAQRRLRLQLDTGDGRRTVRTLTLFVGNNPLQLAQLGLPSDLQPPAAAADAPADPQQHGRLTAIMLRPVGTLEMIGLMAHGALGTLGEAPSVQHFRCTRMTVHLSPYPLGRRRVKVALDGEVTRMSGPLEFRVLETPLQLLACDNPPDSSGGGG